MDTTLFARQTDVTQWKNGFGMALVGARGERSTNGAFQIYEWAFGPGAAEQHGECVRAPDADHVQRHPPGRARPQPGDLP